ncbi:hypothetical protein BGX29_011139 [Mortierella sp. GBA35]|nr:hypothetical protein BGX29_011139 [Mortierella sp. GBA35]
MSNTHTFGSQMSSDEISKMYTTLYDSEDPQQQQEFLHLQQQQQHQYQESQQFIQALITVQNQQLPASPWNETIMSPHSPASSCFSSSSSNSSHSSPATGLKNMDSEEADELVDLFNITIDDLLLGTPLSFAPDMSLFAPHQQQQQQTMMSEAIQFANMRSAEAQQQYFQMQQYQQQQQHYHDHSSSTPCSPCSSYYAASPSLKPAPSTPFSAPTSPLTPIIPHPASPATATTRMPQRNTDGTTVIKNEDGSIMVFNPSTDSITFRCELCPSESFGRIHDLKRHQVSKHQETTWPCEFCMRPFVRRDALLRHYTVKATRDDGVHPPTSDTETLLAARARAKLIG